LNPRSPPSEMDNKPKLSIEIPSGDKPKDAYGIVYILFFLLGLVHVLPWTFFVTAHDYWMHKFRNTSFEDVDSSHRTVLQTEFSPSLTITLQLSTIAFLFLGLFFGHKYSIKLRLFGPLIIILISFIFAAIFIHIDTDTWQEGFFALTMLIVAVINAMSSIFGMAIYSTISNFPAEYLGAYLNGGGMATIFTACLQILSLGISISTESSALVYFWVANVTIALTLFLMGVVRRCNRFYQFNIENYKPRKGKMLSFRQIVNVLKVIWPGPGIMVFFLATNNTVNPALTSLVVSEGEGNGQWNDVYFIPVITFGLYAILDYVGRIISLRLKLNIKAEWFVGFAAVRVFVFIPLFMLCNAQPRNHLPVVFDHDYQFIIIMIMFALTNGYLVNMATLVVQKLAPSDKLEDAYHVHMVVSGIILGALSFLSFISVDLI
jgi:equilibrative nucleoside transporter 1/2/3